MAFGVESVVVQVGVDTTDSGWVLQQKAPLAAGLDYWVVREPGVIPAKKWGAGWPGLVWG
jgi:hypothetical protein